MRWTSGFEINTTRTRRIFCWWPMSYGYPIRHWIWLEWVWLTERVVKGKVGNFWMVIGVDGETV